MRPNQYILLVLVLLLRFVPAVFAADLPELIGMPRNVGVEGGLGVYLVWYENGTWHLRTSTEDTNGKRGTKVVFAGSVVSEGKVTAQGVDLDRKAKDFITPHKDGNGFDFHFTTRGKTDGLTFTIADPGKTLTIKLTIDDKEASTTRIFLGKNGSNPEKSEFTFPARPVK